jgi:hypothetical protein
MGMITNRVQSDKRVAMRCVMLLSFLVVSGGSLRGQSEPAPFNPQSQRHRNQPGGPWQNDVIVYRADLSNKLERLATFARAGVPTLARMHDGRFIAAHQHFPEGNEVDFDKVAVHFSSDEGRTWTDAQVIQLAGLPEGMRFPFDPTLVPLPDNRVRLYFTSLKGRRFETSRPAIYSAVSSNGVDFAVEPGVRFGIEGRPVIDCAVALHNGVFHLFSPDNGTNINPGFQQDQAEKRPVEGIGYYATSRDGLNFIRQDDVRLDGGRRWLGNAQSDGSVLRFFGTGGRFGVWSASSTNGQLWSVEEQFGRVPGADPGAVKLKDGNWLLAVTGPPREGRERDDRPGQFDRPFHSALMDTLDANGDGTIDGWEQENAAALLRKLDRNRDGQLSTAELGNQDSRSIPRPEH